MSAALTAATTIGAVTGAIVGVLTVLRIPVVNRPLRWIGRQLFSDPVGGWARQQVGAVVTEQLQESTRWLAEGQARMGGEIEALRTGFCEGSTEMVTRLVAIETKTAQLAPNGGASLFDRLQRIEELGDRMESVQLKDRPAPLEDRPIQTFHDPKEP